MTRAVQEVKLNVASIESASSSLPLPRCAAASTFPRVHGGERHVVERTTCVASPLTRLRDCYIAASGTPLRAAIFPRGTRDPARITETMSPVCTWRAGSTPRALFDVRANPPVSRDHTTGARRWERASYSRSWSTTLVSLVLEGDRLVRGSSESRPARNRHANVPQGVATLTGCPLIRSEKHERLRRVFPGGRSSSAVDVHHAR